MTHKNDQQRAGFRNRQVTARDSRAPRRSIRELIRPAALRTLGGYRLPASDCFGIEQRIQVGKLRL